MLLSPQLNEISSDKTAKPRSGSLVDDDPLYKRDARYGDNEMVEFSYETTPLTL